MSGKNKLHGEKNKMIYVQMGIIVFVILLAVGLYLAYMMIDYAAARDAELEMNADGLMDFAGYLSAPEMKAPLNLETAWIYLLYQVTKLWWIYAVAAFGAFLMAKRLQKRLGDMA